MKTTIWKVLCNLRSSGLVFFLRTFVRNSNNVVQQAPLDEEETWNSEEEEEIGMDDEDSMEVDNDVDDNN